LLFVVVVVASGMVERSAPAFWSLFLLVHRVLLPLSVLKVTQSLWRRRAVNEESGSGRRFSLRSSYC
jgi:hypothetical protein